MHPGDRGSSPRGSIWFDSQSVAQWPEHPVWARVAGSTPAALIVSIHYEGGASCIANRKIIGTTSIAFERTSKRRKGYPSETRVKRGVRIVHVDKELNEKLGRNDLCPCGSGVCF